MKNFDMWLPMPKKLPKNMLTGEERKDKNRIEALEMVALKGDC